MRKTTRGVFGLGVLLALLLGACDSGDGAGAPEADAGADAGADDATDEPQTDEPQTDEPQTDDAEPDTDAGADDGAPDDHVTDDHVTDDPETDDPAADDPEADGPDDAEASADDATEAGAPGSGEQVNDGGSTGASGDAGPTDGEHGEAGTGEPPVDDSPLLPLYESGSRLRAVSLGAPGSDARRLQIWYDTELESECSFGYAEDGVLRCLPLAFDLSPGYLDEECTQVVYYDYRSEPCASLPGYRREATDVQGCSAQRVVRLQPITASAVIHESCSGDPMALAAGTGVWQDAEVMTPSRFVAASRRERANARGFGVVELVAEDGAREVIGMFDARYGSCNARELEGAGMRCAAVGAFVEPAWWFAEEGCSGEVLAYGSRISSCVEPAERALVPDFEGGGLPSVVSLGAPVEGTAYERTFGDGACEARDASQLLWTLYSVEGEFDPSQFFALSETTLGEGPVQTLHYSIDDEPLSLVAGGVVAPLMFDAERGAPCAGYRWGAAWVCMPVDTYALIEPTRYADADCSEPVAFFEADVPERALWLERDFCVREGFGDRVAGVFEVSATHAGALYAVGDAGCALLSEEPEAGYYALSPLPEPGPALDETRE